MADLPQRRRILVVRLLQIAQQLVAHAKEPRIPVQVVRLQVARGAPDVVLELLRRRERARLAGIEAVQKVHVERVDGGAQRDANDDDGSDQFAGHAGRRRGGVWRRIEEGSEYRIVRRFAAREGTGETDCERVATALAKREIMNTMRIGGRLFGAYRRARDKSKRGCFI